MRELARENEDNEKRFYKVRTLYLLDTIPFFQWKREVKRGTTVEVKQVSYGFGEDHYHIQIPKKGTVVHVSHFIGDGPALDEPIYPVDLASSRRAGPADGGRVRLERQLAYKFRMWRRKHFGKGK